MTKCEQCGREFMNSSACRFHQLKQHLKPDVSETNEKRIVQRNCVEPRIIMAFHCPDASCSSKKEWFDGQRNLRQHYYRAHAEKKFTCEMCGYKVALEKDLNYHRKARCSVMKKQLLQQQNHGEKKKASRKREFQVENEEQETTEPEAPSTSAGTHTVLQPIYFIVSPENVHQVMETVQKSLSTSAEASTQVQFVEQEPIPMYSTTTQYDQEPPVTFCERGTMMHGQEPLSYFSPPYGAEFGDLSPPEQQQQKSQPFDYSSTSVQQPQTRSFGTMFENVTTCNTGTSTIDESSYVSEFLRDIETQTPSFMVRSSSNSTAPAAPTNDDWTWTRDI